jgi:hypothetical protein
VALDVRAADCRPRRRGALAIARCDAQQLRPPGRLAGRQHHTLGDLEIAIGEGTAAWLDIRGIAGVHHALEAADALELSVTTVEVRTPRPRANLLIRRP